MARSDILSVIREAAEAQDFSGSDNSVGDVLDAAADEIERLRAMAYLRGEELARAWVVGVTGTTEVDAIVDPDQQAWSAMTGDHVPETLADALIDHTHQAQSAIERLRKALSRWKHVAELFGEAFAVDEYGQYVPSDGSDVHRAVLAYERAKREEARRANPS